MSAFAAQDAMAQEILTEHRGKVLAIVKATRAGATFSLLKRAYELKQKTVIVAPYIQIFDNTVEEVGRSFSVDKPKIARIAANEDICTKVAERIEKNAQLRTFPFHYRPSCVKCECNDPKLCRLQEILTRDWDILGLTYAKLRSLCINESETAIDLLNKVKLPDNLILDEFVTGIITTMSSVLIEEPHAYLEREFNYSERMMKSAPDAEFWAGIAEFALVTESMGNGLSDGKSTIYKNTIQDEYGDFFEVNFSKCWRRLEQLANEGKDTGLLQQILQVITSKEFFIIKKDGKISVKPVEDLNDTSRGSRYLSNFIRKFSEKDKIITLVDAYLPDLDLEKDLGIGFEFYSWGDPLRTNQSQLIVCDTRRIGDFNFFRSRELQEQVKATVNSLCRLHKSSTIMIATQNKDIHNVLKLWQKHKQIPEDIIVTYYRSDISRGITVPTRRVLILIGGPDLPKEAYFPETYVSAGQAKGLQTAFKKFDMKSAFINMIGRVKDPKGQEPSIVYALGMLSDEVRKLLKQKGIVQPFVAGFPVTGIDEIDFMIVAGLFLETPRERWRNTNDIAIIARLIRKCQDKGTLRCWEVVPNQTEKVQQAVGNYADILRDYGIETVRTPRGLSLVYSKK